MGRSRPCWVWWLWLGVAGACGGCGDGGAAGDAGSDAGRADASRLDAGGVDAAGVDAGSVDAGSTDAGAGDAAIDLAACASPDLRGLERVDAGPSDLAAAIVAAEARSRDEARGTVIQLAAGEYGGLPIEDRTFTEAAPLYILGAPDLASTFTGGGYRGVYVARSSYVFMASLHVLSGWQDGVTVAASDHVVICDFEIHDLRQAGVVIHERSSYVDLLYSRIHDTGQENPQWGEGVYVGTGGSGGFPDTTEHVWLEGSIITRTANSEGVNVKPETFHVTVRGNDISDTRPGTATQYNQSALTIEGSRGTDFPRNGEERDVWVEANRVSNVRLGRWADGIMVGGTGVYVLDNEVSDCEQDGIYVNGFGDLGMPVFIFGNMVTAVGGSDYRYASGVDVREESPGANPNRPQTWW